MTRVNLPPLAINNRAALDAKLAEHDGALDALEGNRDNFNTAVKYLYAKATPTIHMEIDLQGLTDLVDLGGSDSQALVSARANALKAAWNLHLAGAGSLTVDGEHKTADATNVVVAADAATTGGTALSSCITLVNALLASVIAHGDETDVHFLDDTGSGGTGASITTDPPTTKAHCITDLNDLKLAMSTHMAAGSIDVQ
jgi:hypothetical protein